MKALPVQRALGYLGAMAVAGLLGGCSGFVTTTNGVTSSAQSIGDASTSTSDGTTNLFKSKDDAKTAAFVNGRFEAIRYQAARGAGEDLDALATLLHEPDRAQFARWMKDHYEGLFSGVVEPRELLVRLDFYRAANRA